MCDQKCKTKWLWWDQTESSSLPDAVILRSTPGITELPSDDTTIPATESPTTQTTESEPVRTSTGSKCHRCSYKYNSEDTYCKNCGAKLLGRDYGLSKELTPLGSSNCVNCKEQLEPDALFCANCGVKVQQRWKKLNTYFL